MFDSKDVLSHAQNKLQRLIISWDIRFLQILNSGLLKAFRTIPQKQSFFWHKVYNGNIKNLYSKLPPKKSDGITFEKNP